MMYEGYRMTGVGALPEEWDVVRLGDILKYEQPTKYIVKNTEYDKNNGIPVLTPGKTFILGYTDEKEGVYINLPVILFDDFTTESKFIQFSFKIKSSAVKLLKEKNDNCILKFVYETIPSPLTSTNQH